MAAKMKRIDPATVQRILDTADIVEVVSEFVSLKRSGANYIGLCPFHNERTPSFSVSRAKGICKCFSCGKGGSPVNFIMEHEQLTYWEALRWLANKYHIEIEEHDITDEERQEISDRQAMMEANAAAMAHFEHNLLDTPDGQEIGLAYFRHRGINDWAISRFHLGYSLDRRDDLFKALKAKGVGEKHAISTGLCIKNDRGQIYDRFKARVMYPVFTISGKVVAFGGRTLRTDKEVAKYVNSPESLIYSKSKELYGLYQAKKAIVQKNRCILVEGYMDVISMHQQGVENVVASSGTSLTQGQIRLIHRFTENVTVIYDSDPAGIKASLRGIDLLLAEGMNIKVLLLPDGDDPDSFAQSHSAQEVEDYLNAHEVDFITFKTDILLKETGNDPIKRSHALGSIISSIAHIPVEITRSMYIKECSARFDIDEKILLRQLNVEVAKIAEQEAQARRRKEAADSFREGERKNDNAGSQGGGESQDSTHGPSGQKDMPDGGQDDRQEEINYDLLPAQGAASESDELRAARLSGIPHAAMLLPQERNLLRLVVKYGMVELIGDDFCLENGEHMRVVDYVNEDLEVDNMKVSNPQLQKVFEAVLELRNGEWNEDYARACSEADAHKLEKIAQGREQLKATATTSEQISGGEQVLLAKCEEECVQEKVDYATNYIGKRLMSHPDDDIRTIVTNLIAEKHQLSKIFYKSTKIESEIDRLGDLVLHSLIALKYDMARCNASDIRQQILELQRRPEGYDMEEILRLMALQNKWQVVCTNLASQIGERVYEPLR